MSSLCAKLKEYFFDLWQHLYISPMIKYKHSKRQFLNPFFKYIPSPYRQPKGCQFFYSFLMIFTWYLFFIQIPKNTDRNCPCSFFLIRLQHNDTQLSGTDGYAPKIGDQRGKRGKCHSQAIGLWKKGNDGVAADCQHLLE